MKYRTVLSVLFVIALALTQHFPEHMPIEVASLGIDCGDEVELIRSLQNVPTRWISRVELQFSLVH